MNLHNQQHVLVMCAVAFYMMENYPLDVGSEFNAGIIQVSGLSVTMVNSFLQKKNALQNQPFNDHVLFYLCSYIFFVALTSIGNSSCLFVKNSQQ